MLCLNNNTTHTEFNGESFKAYRMLIAIPLRFTLLILVTS